MSVSTGVEQAAAADASAEPAPRRQQRLEELCAAALRALSGEPGLVFRGHRLYRGAQALPIEAPHLQVDPAVDDFAGSLRGAADGFAMRLRFSDAALHRCLAPADPVQRLIFEQLEQYRCEAQATLSGVRLNLLRRHRAWTDAFLASRLTESVSGLLLFTVAQIARSRLTGDGLSEALEDLMEGTRMTLAPAIGADLAGLRRQRHDQRAFAVHALAIAAHVAAQVATDELPKPEDEAEGERRTPDAPPRFTLWLAPAPQGSESAGHAGRGRPAGPDDGPDAYRVFTRAHDREQAAAAGIREALLRSWRAQLDARVAAQGLNLPRLARELRAVLAQPVDDGWAFAQPEGLVDGRRLAQLVARPDERRLFRQPRPRPVADAAVSLLLDCSGSMREHAESLALLADVMLRALELAGAEGELLGFTTGSWRGGRAAKDWERAGRPARPGRLADALHLVFKDFDTPWRRARPSIASLLKPDRFREGVDGEAIDWACARLLARPARRRCLVVVSDGCPMETATQQANDPGYLDRHWRQVVARHEAEGRLDIVGLGLGLDLSGVFRRSRVMDLDGALRNRLFDDVLALLARPRSRRG